MASRCCNWEDGRLPYLHPEDPAPGSAHQSRTGTLGFAPYLPCPWQLVTPDRDNLDWSRQISPVGKQTKLIFWTILLRRPLSFTTASRVYNPLFFCCLVASEGSQQAKATWKPNIHKFYSCTCSSFRPTEKYTPNIFFSEPYASSIVSRTSSSCFQGLYPTWRSQGNNSKILEQITLQSLSAWSRIFIGLSITIQL